MNPTLLIVTSQTCPACTRFKQSVMPGLEKKLERFSGNLYTADLSGFDSSELRKLVPNFPESVQEYVKWYPTLLLFPAGSWIPEVLNSTVVNGEIQPLRSGGVAFTPEDINAWINETITSNPRFTQSKGGNSYFTPPKGNVRYVLVENGQPITTTVKPRFVRREH